MLRHPAQPCALIADDDANVRTALSAAVGLVGLASVMVEDSDDRPSKCWPTCTRAWSSLEVQLPNLMGSKCVGGSDASATLRVFR